MTDSQSSPANSRTAGIILCGGKSTRMGRSKWSLPFGDENCLLRTLRILREVVSPVIVVAADDQDVSRLPSDVTIVRDQIPEKGPLAGISAGLEFLQQEQTISAAYITACDVPLLKPEFVATVIDHLGDRDLAVVKEGKFFHPLAGVYRVNLADRVASLLEQDRLRPLFLIEESNSREIDVEELRDVDPDLDSLRNMNTPQEYRAILESLKLPIPEWLE